jgi:regulator of sigma E protease
MHELWMVTGIAMLAFFGIVTVIVFIHESGHYLAARACGVAVQVFSIGFGREIFAWTDRRGTRWRLCILPFGGFVKMTGEDGTARDADGQRRPLTAAERRVSYFHRPARHRAAIVVAGPLANLVFAVATLAALTLGFGRIVDRPEIGDITPDSPAAVAGFLPGDRIVAVNGAPVRSFTEFKTQAAARGDGPVTVEILRGGAPERLALGADDGRWNGSFGLKSNGRERISVGLVDSVAYGLQATWRFAVASLEAVRDLLRGGSAAEGIAGPVRFAQLSGQATLDFGIGALVLLAALLSVNVAVFNLLPVPALDGGHLAFLGLEKLRGRPLPRRVQQFSSMAGFALVILLCVLMTANDLANLIG